jgi:tryptophan-rich sensory protein
MIQLHRAPPRVAGLGSNLSLFVLPVVLLNGVIFGLGWNRTSVALPGLPPGWFVGSLWLLLFAGMGIARWLLVRHGTERGGRAAVAGVELLGFLCLIYPLYTIGLSNDRIGLTGNVVTLLVAVPAAVLAFRRSRAAGGCLVAVCLWLSYAAAVTGNGLARGLTH